MLIGCEEVRMEADLGTLEGERVVDIEGHEGASQHAALEAMEEH